MYDSKIIETLDSAIRKAHGEGWDYVDLSIDDAREILGALRRDEPRVMTLEEMEMREESCFLEVNGDDGAIVLIQNVDCGGVWDFLSTTPGFLRHSTWQAVDYGTTWRCWTPRPTPEQMRDTPWEGENNA